MSPLAQGRDRVVLRLHVQPGARRDEVVGLHGDRLKVKVAAPPVDGAANERVLALVAELFEIRRVDVTLVSGASSRRKDVGLEGLPLEAAQARLAVLLDPQVR